MVILNTLFKRDRIFFSITKERKINTKTYKTFGHDDIKQHYYVSKFFIKFAILRQKKKFIKFKKEKREKKKEKN